MSGMLRRNTASQSGSWQKADIEQSTRRWPIRTISQESSSASSYSVSLKSFGSTALFFRCKTSGTGTSVSEIWTRQMQRILLLYLSYGDAA